MAEHKEECITGNYSGVLTGTVSKEVMKQVEEEKNNFLQLK
jgi:hypothetical protein